MSGLGDKFFSQDKVDSESSTPQSNVVPNVVTKTKIIKEKMPIPDYNDLIKFAKKFMDTDIECEQFFEHGATHKIYKRHYGEARGGGGWSGAIKATINILNKMRRNGEL